MKSRSYNEGQEVEKTLIATNVARNSTLSLAVMIGLLNLFSLSLGIAAQQKDSKTAKIPDGTIVSVTLTDELSSGKNHQNDPVHGIVAEEVKVGDTVVLAKGASVIGHITQAEPKGKWGHSGSLAYSLDYAKAVDGSNVRLRASSSQGGEQSKAALMLGLSGALKQGKDTQVAKGTSSSAYVEGDHTITLSPSDH
jgi:hypothetical protein